MWSALTEYLSRGRTEALFFSDDTAASMTSVAQSSWADRRKTLITYTARQTSRSRPEQTSRDSNLAQASFQIILACLTQTTCGLSKGVPKGFLGAKNAPKYSC